MAVDKISEGRTDLEDSVQKEGQLACLIKHVYAMMKPRLETLNWA